MRIKGWFRAGSRPGAAAAHPQLASLQPWLHRWVYHQLPGAEQGPEPVHSVWGENSSPVQVTQVLSPSYCTQSVLLFLFFTPSPFSSSLRYLTLGRNVRRRNMSIRELWVLPRALALPGSFCFYFHWHSMTNVGDTVSLWAQISWISYVWHKVAPFKFFFFSHLWKFFDL